ILKAPLTGNMQLRVLDMNGKLIETKTGSIQENNIYTFSFSRLHSVANGVYTIQYSDDKNRASLRVVKQ
ncbi:MAG: T9SS type A sorting domain-containing protein, partial [Bacteroidota bacterium]|nr:T9SS type A sorting domain-containing protein [Bacteroidota bacterium]